MRGFLVGELKEAPKAVGAVEQWQCPPVALQAMHNHRPTPMPLCLLPGAAELSHSFLPGLLLPRPSLRPCPADPGPDLLRQCPLLPVQCASEWTPWALDLGAGMCHQAATSGASDEGPLSTRADLPELGTDGPNRPARRLPTSPLHPCLRSAWCPSGSDAAQALVVLSRASQALDRIRAKSPGTKSPRAAPSGTHRFRIGLAPGWGGA